MPLVSLPVRWFAFNTIFTVAPILMLDLFLSIHLAFCSIYFLIAIIIYPNIIFQHTSRNGTFAVLFLILQIQ